MSYSYVNLKHCPQELKELAYFSLGQSILEYASIVWDLYLQRLFRTIENVHQRAARYVTKVWAAKCCDGVPKPAKMGLLEAWSKSVIFGLMEKRQDSHDG